MTLPSQSTPGPDHAAGIEPKVKAATVAQLPAAVIVSFVLWAIDGIWYGGGEIDVPVPVVGLVTLVVGAASAFIGGYLAPHVQR